MALGFGCPLPSLQSSAHWRENTVLSMKPIPSFVILNYTKHVGGPKIPSTQAKKLRWALKFQMIWVNLGTSFWGTELRWEQGAKGFRLMTTFQHRQPDSPEEAKSLVTFIHNRIKPSLKLDFLWTF